jgi:hypothetical protein
MSWKGIRSSDFSVRTSRARASPVPGKNAQRVTGPGTAGTCALEHHAHEVCAVGCWCTTSAVINSTKNRPRMTTAFLRKAGLDPSTY